MNFILDDITSKTLLYPFTAIKSAAYIRMGILTIRERWERLLGMPIRLLSEMEQEVSTDMMLIPANVIPDKEGADTLMQSGLNAFLQSATIKTIHHPADIFKYNDWVLKNDFKLLTHKKVSQLIPASNRCGSSSQIFIEPGAIVEHCILNAAHGPIYIGKNAEIMEGSMIRGPFALCEGAVVKMGAKIYGATTIGPYCIAGGEIKNSVMFGYSNKGHDGYLGDSVIGEWCNLGAGTSNSNIKNTAGMVKVWDHVKKNFIATTHKCGLLMGDYSRAGINTSFNTGTTVGVCCNIFGETYPPKYVADFSWGNEVYELEKALVDIDNWKKLKGSGITEEEKSILTNLYHTKITN